MPLTTIKQERQANVKDFKIPDTGSVGITKYWDIANKVGPNIDKRLIIAYSVYFHNLTW